MKEQKQNKSGANANVFEVIALMKVNKKMSRPIDWDLLFQVTELDEKIVSVSRVFTGTVQQGDMERFVSLKVEAQTPEEAVNHIKQNYNLLLTNCYYKPPAEPAQGPVLPQ